MRKTTLVLLLIAALSGCQKSPSGETRPLRLYMKNLRLFLRRWVRGAAEIFIVNRNISTLGFTMRQFTTSLQKQIGIFFSGNNLKIMD